MSQLISFSDKFSLYLNMHDVTVDYTGNHKPFTQELAKEFANYICTSCSREADIKIRLYDLNLAPHLTREIYRLIQSGHNIEQATLQNRITNIVDFSECSLNLFVRQAWNIDEALLMLISSLSAMLRFKLSQRLTVAAFHAAALAWDKSGLLVVGDSGAGKTSLSCICAWAGFNYLADEDSFVRQQTKQSWQILAYQRRIRLSNETLAHYPEFIRRETTRLFKIFNQQGYIVDLNQISPGSYLLSAPLEAIVILRNDKTVRKPHLSNLNKSSARLWLLHSLESVAATDPSWKHLNRQGYYLVDNLLDFIEVIELKYNISEHLLLVPELLRNILVLTQQKDKARANLG